MPRKVEIGDIWHKQKMFLPFGCILSDSVSPLLLALYLSPFALSSYSFPYLLLFISSLFSVSYTPWQSPPGHIPTLASPFPEVGAGWWVNSHLICVHGIVWSIIHQLPKSPFVDKTEHHWGDLLLRSFLKNAERSIWKENLELHPQHHIPFSYSSSKKNISSFFFF